MDELLFLIVLLLGITRLFDSAKALAFINVPTREEVNCQTIDAISLHCSHPLLLVFLFMLLSG